MKRRILFKRCCLYFSAWSRKGYAVFAGLGKEVRISPLALHICGAALLKSALKGVIVNRDNESEMAVAVACKEVAAGCVQRKVGEVCPAINKIRV